MRKKENNNNLENLVVQAERWESIRWDKIILIGNFNDNEIEWIIKKKKKERQENL